MQIDKKAWALVAGVKNFHNCFCGRPFEMVTDHKPLLGPFAPDCKTPQILSSRMMRWAIFFAAYVYQLSHHPGKSLGHADTLSCLSLSEWPSNTPQDFGIMLTEDWPQLLHPLKMWPPTLPMTKHSPSCSSGCGGGSQSAVKIQSSSHSAPDSTSYWPQVVFAVG